MKNKVWKPDYENLKQLLGVICLRRSTTVLALHGVEFVEYRPQLSEVERKVYDGLAKSCKRSIDVAVSSRGSQRQNQAIMIGLLRLRMFCNSGIAYTLKPDQVHLVEQLVPDEMISLLQQSGDATCTECGSDILTMETQGGDERQSTVFGSRLRCLECVSVDSERPHIGGSHSEDNTSPNNSILDNNQDETPKDLHSRHGGLSLYSNSTPEAGVYSSKLKALLTDIKEHYSNDKWYSSELP
jgi:SWI/SNF-related matrix-associated actin-dependent regulator of chromatin subfamily A3